MNKIGQISSENRGVYDESSYPTESQFLNEWESLKQFEVIDEEIFIIEEEQKVIAEPINPDEKVTVEESDKDGGINIAIIIVCLIICFLIPWVFIGAWHIRKKI